MNSSAYIQLLFHSASGNPLLIDNPPELTDTTKFSLSMFHLPKKGSSTSKTQIKAYRLTAYDQFILDMNYTSIYENDDQESMIVNVDDIQAFPNGIHYSPSYILCFNMKVPDFSSLSFKLRVTLYKSTSGSSDPENVVTSLVCESFHSGRQFRNCNTGSLTGILISQKLEHVGSITFDYLITSVWLGVDRYLNIVNSFKFANLNRPLMIGHRGSGCSFCINPSKYLENTMNSFLAAQECGADFIELDVQLTRDKAVVVFHDFHTEAIFDLNLKTVDDNSRVEIPLRDLNLHQLKKNRFKHAFSKHFDRPLDSVSDASSDEGLMFPLIGEVMSLLPAHVGLDIELKFPQQERSGTWELEGSYFDRNTVVERVLEEVFQNNCTTNRPIFFSSFDPGICVMLRQKQKQYPVIFLVNSMNNSSNYNDMRCQNIKTAVTFAQAENLQGLCAEIDPIITVISKISKIVHSNGLRLFTWGKGNNDIDVIKKQADCMVDGIIFDRIYDFLPLAINNTL